MPTYVYRFVKTGETIEVQQPFNEATLTSVKHPKSGRKMAVKKVFTPVGVTFRGDGFYKTDSRGSATKKSEAKPDASGESKAASSESSPSKDSTSKADTSAGSSKPKKSDTKAAATP